MNTCNIYYLFLLKLAFHNSILNAESRRALSTSGGARVTGKLTIGKGATLYWGWRASMDALSNCTVVTPTGSEIALGGAGSRGGEGVSYLGPGLGYGYCGVQVDFLQPKKDNGTWTLKTNQNNSVSTEVTVLEKQPGVVNQTLEVDESELVRLSCGPDEATWCRMRGPRGGEEWAWFDGPCATSTPVPATFANTNGTWHCQFTTASFVRPSFAHTTILVQARKPKTELGYNETSTEVNIFCNLRGSPKTVLYCLLRSPKGEDYFLSPERGTARYRWYGSKSTENSSNCGVTIPKPLLQEEYGSWICDLTLQEKYPSHYGGYVYVKQQAKGGVGIEGGRVFMEAAEELVTVVNGSRLTLSCQANGSLDYCWFKSPRGLQIPSTKVDFVRGLSFGVCQLSFEGATETTAGGKWTCSGGSSLGSTGSTEPSAGFRVVVIPRGASVIGEPRVVRGKLGSRAEVKCVHTERGAIRQCRFIRPDGAGLSIGDHAVPAPPPSQPAPDYSYYGRGLSYGECGIQIRALHNWDFGNWTCVLTLLSSDAIKQEQYFGSFLIQQTQGLSVPAIIGIVIGCLMLIAGISVVIVKFIRPSFTRTNRSEERDLLDESIDREIFQVENVHEDITRRRNSRLQGAQIKCR